MLVRQQAGSDDREAGAEDAVRAEKERGLAIVLRLGHNTGSEAKLPATKTEEAPWRGRSSWGFGGAAFGLARSRDSATGRLAGRLRRFSAPFGTPLLQILHDPPDRQGDFEGLDNDLQPVQDHRITPSLQHRVATTHALHRTHPRLGEGEAGTFRVG